MIDTLHETSSPQAKQPDAVNGTAPVNGAKAQLRSGVSVVIPARNEEHPSA